MPLSPFGTTRISRILLVEDDHCDARLVSETLADAGFDGDTLVAATRLDEALHCLAMDGIGCVLLDLSLPDSLGLSTLKRVYEAAPDVPIIVMTGLDDEALAVEALREGAQDYFVKGHVSAAVLTRSVRYACERMQIAATLRESEEHYRAIIDHARDVLVTISPDGRIVSLNRAFEVVTGWQRAAWIGQSFQPLLHPEDLAVVRQAFQYPFEAVNALHSRELRVLQASGVYVVGEFSFAICRVSGQPVSLLAVARDITSRKKIEEESRQARVTAERATRAKSEFLARMSHEIRTPMNGVLGMTELVLESELNPEQRSRMNTLQGSAQLLLRVIDEILDFSRLEAGKLSLVSESFRLRDTFEATEWLLVRAEQKNLTLSYEIAPDVPATLIGDSDRIYQILVNLIGNAIKFTHRGGVVTQVRRLSPAEDASSVELQFTVRDTGIGVPPEALQLIFTPFEQADGSKARSFGGSGLGLAISAQLVDLMGGRIWVESTPGEGSAFHFAIRCDVGSEESVAAASAVHAALEPTSPLAKSPGPERVLHVLLAEDNPVNQNIARSVLQQRGHSVVIADNGVAALAAFAREEFDIILMDVQMPEMDGYEAAVEIRRIEGTQARPGHVPIVAMTANALPRDRQRCLEAGMDGFLPKPVKSAVMVATIERHAASRPA